jgi:competence protein ComEA
VRILSGGQQIILLGLGLALLGPAVYGRLRPSISDAPPVRTDIAVEIVGAVPAPGLHFFPSPPRLEEAIERAGGFKEMAARFDEAAAALPIGPGTLLTVEEGRAGEIRVRQGRMEARKLLVFGLPVDLNRATADDLRLLSGIGEGLAREIVARRDRRKGFRSVEELRDVRGIGEKKLARLRPFVTVAP